MFSQVRIENFKPFADTGTVPLAPLTVLIGKNNAGKSSLFHALLALKQTAMDRSPSPALVTSGRHVKLGTFEDIYHQQADPDGAIRFTLTLDREQNRRFATQLLPEQAEGKAQYGLSVAFKYEQKRNRVVVSTSRLTVEEEVVADAVRSGSGFRSPSMPSSHLDHVHTGLINFIPSLSLDPESPPESSEIAEELFRNSLRWETAKREWLRIFQASLEHVSPLRKIIPRYTYRGEEPGSWVGVGGETLLRELRSDELLHGSQTLFEHLDDWVSEGLGLLDELELRQVDQEGRILALVGREPHVEDAINVAGMGAGISQLLPIIAAVVKTPPYGCLLVEQPEIHLHPAAQANMADLFVDGIRRRSRQFIVETHSEHVLLRIRRRIAEGKLDQDQVSILFVEKPGAEAEIKHIPVSGNGDVEGWPEGFFEEDYEEALALAKAGAAARG